MDARGVQRLLEKTYGMAETATAAGFKTSEGVARDARLSDALKQKLLPLYREEALRRTLTYANLGLAICRAVEMELDDDAARAQLEFYRAGFEKIRDAARNELGEFANSRVFEME